MNGRVLGIALVLLGAVAALGAEIGIEFSGVLGSGKDLRVALTDQANGSTRWVPLGGRFAGYVVSSYDAKADVLVLAKDGRQIRLPLKQAKVGKGGVKPPPELERAIMNNLRQLAAAADQFYLENGKTSVTYDELVGPDKYVKTMTSHDGENYRAIQFAQGNPLRVTTQSGHTISYEP